MRKYLGILAPCCLAASLSGLCQTANPSSDKNGWGPWHSTNNIVAGIVFRSKCVGSADGDSTWAYQFRNRHDGDNVFVEREQHGAEGTLINDWGTPMIVALDRGKISPKYEAHLHGTCAALHELKIEVICDTDAHLWTDPPCFHDAGGAELERKPDPSASHAR